MSLIVKDCMENPFSGNLLAVSIPVKLFVTVLFLDAFVFPLIIEFTTDPLDSHWAR